MKKEYVKIVVFVPESHADEVREALSESGCGCMGNYAFCSFSSKGIGRFRPCEGANPFIGESGKIEEVEEERIETICSRENLDSALAAVKKAHPYEEPAIDIYPVLT